LYPPLRRIQWPRVQWSDLMSKAVRFGLLLAAVAFAFSALLAPHIGLFQRLELTTEDIRLRLRGERPIHPAIVTIEIEEKTLFHYRNTWPIPRDQYALLFNGLKNAGARVVGVDLLFIGQDINNPPIEGNPITNDQLLAAVIARDPRIINGFYFPLIEPDGHDLAPIESLTIDPRRRIWQRFTMPLPDGVDLLHTTDVPFDMEEEIAESSYAVGHVGLFQDVDNTIRSLPLLVNYRGRAFPALSLLMVASYLGGDWRDIRFRNNRAFLPYPGGELTLPVDRHAQILINYPGPDKVFKTSAIRFDQVQRSIALRDSLESVGKTAPMGLLERVNGKVVLVCNTATTTAFADFGQTPFSQLPLAYTHTSVVNSMLRGDFLSKVPREGQAVLWFLLAIALALILAALTPVALALTVLSTIVALLVVSWGMIAFGGQIIEVVPPILMIGIISLGHLLRGYIVRDRQRRAQEQELAVARRIQQDLLPKSVLAVSDLEVVGANRPCFEVGGDYFDYFNLADGRIALAIADVAGKGVPAALLMSNLQAILRAECARGTDVPQVPTQANRQLMESLAGNSKFVTFFYGALDPKTRRLSYSNAGHNPPLLVRKSGAIEELGTGGLILGVFPLAEYDQGTVDLSAGDLLVLFTDGVTEAESRHGLYSDERLQELLLKERGRSAKDIAQAILTDVDLFSHGRHQTDDVTVVVVKVAGAAA
jgi:CHASE2 domain-containing sensor protein